MTNTLSLLQYNHNIITSEKEETVENKANVDADNFSTTGYDTLSGLGMPSGTYTDLTVSTTVYTAPANGWVWLYLHWNSGSSSVSELINDTKGYSIRNQNITAGGYWGKFMPVAAGDEFYADYGSTPTSSSKYRFYYAIGAEPAG